MNVSGHGREFHHPWSACLVKTSVHIADPMILASCCSRSCSSSTADEALLCTQLLSRLHDSQAREPNTFQLQAKARRHEHGSARAEVAPAAQPSSAAPLATALPLPSAAAFAPEHSGRTSFSAFAAFELSSAGQQQNRLKSRYGASFTRLIGLRLQQHCIAVISETSAVSAARVQRAASSIAAYQSSLLGTPEDLAPSAEPRPACAVGLRA